MILMTKAVVAVALVAPGGDEEANGARLGRRPLQRQEQDKRAG